MYYYLLISSLFRKIYYKQYTTTPRSPYHSPNSYFSAAITHPCASVTLRVESGNAARTLDLSLSTEVSGWFTVQAISMLIPRGVLKFLKQNFNYKKDNSTFSSKDQLMILMKLPTLSLKWGKKS